jgi:hypothetical protein
MWVNRFFYSLDVDLMKLEVLNSSLSESWLYLFALCMRMDWACIDLELNMEG